MNIHNDDAGVLSSALNESAQCSSFQPSRSPGGAEAYWYSGGGVANT